MPEFEAGEGLSTQLPRGGATAVNEGTNVVAPEPIDVAPQDAAPAPEEEAAPAATAEEDVPVEAAAPEDYLPDYQPVDEDDDFVTGPTARPGEDQSVGTAPRRGLSPRVAKNLSLLQQAAQVQGASAELQALVSYLTRNA